MKSGGSGTRVLGIGLVFALVVMAFGLMIAIMENWGRQQPELMLIGLVGETFVLLVLMLGPVGKAIASLLTVSSDNEVDGLMAERMTEMDERILDLQAEVQRLSEMESRLDFTERLLAKPIADFTREGR